MAWPVGITYESYDALALSSPSASPTNKCKNKSEGAMRKAESIKRWIHNPASIETKLSNMIQINQPVN